MALDQPARAFSAAGLFATDREKGQGQRGGRRLSVAKKSDQMGDPEALVIDGSPTIEGPVLDLRREGLVGPARPGRDDIEVVHEHQCGGPAHRGRGVGVEKRLACR